MLSDLGVGRLIIVGAQTDPVIAHTNLYWKYQTAPGRTAGTVEPTDVSFGEGLQRGRAMQKRNTSSRYSTAIVGSARARAAG